MVLFASIVNLDWVVGFICALVLTRVGPYEFPINGIEIRAVDGASSMKKASLSARSTNISFSVGTNLCQPHFCQR